MDKLDKDFSPLITLTKGQRVIYNLFLDAMQRGKNDVILPTVVNSNNIIYYIKLVIAENPELCTAEERNCQSQLDRRGIP